MYLILIWATKLIQKLSRLVGNSGAALPGLIVERIYPQFLGVALRKLPEGVIVISGTNGKTSTTKIVADSLHHMGDRVMTNRTGSNMTRGLVSLIVSKSSLTGRLPYDIAVLEVDEAYAAKLVTMVPIRGALILNVMRDQLDRFGEIDTTATYLNNLSRAADSFVVLNAFDSRVAQLEVSPGVSKTYFGVSKILSSELRTEDGWYGTQKPSPGYDQAEYLLLDSKNNTFTTSVKDKKYTAATQFEGVHNHLNAVAALALLHHIKPEENIDNLLRLIEEAPPAFGRGEKVRVGDSDITLLLVKNPSSFVQTLHSTDVQAFATTSVIINDAYADSRDVSWLWDVDVSKLGKARTVYTGGRRGYDMAVRLKYADIPVEKIIIEPKEIIAELSKQKGSHAVFCTYTAMLALRRQLIRLGHLEQVV